MLKGYNPGGVELQSTSLIRGKTICWTRKHTTKLHFNPLPSSEGRQAPKDNGKKLQITSIHFPHPREDDIHRKVHRTGRTSIHFPHPREDSDTHIPRMNLLYFNPLPSSEGRQQNFLILFSNPNIFLVHLHNFIFYLSNSPKKSRNSAIKP